MLKFLARAYCRLIVRGAVRQCLAVFDAAEDDSDPYWAPPLWDELGECETQQEFTARETILIDHILAMAKKAFSAAAREALEHPIRCGLRELFHR